MDFELKDINSTFTKAVRTSKTASTWKKAGTRLFTDKSGNIHYGYHLEYHDKATNQNSRRLAYAFVVTLPYETSPPDLYSMVYNWKNSVLTLKLYVDLSNEGLLTHKANNVAITVHNLAELNSSHARFIELADIHAPKWVSTMCSKESINEYLRAQSGELSSLWIERETYGNDYCLEKFIQLIKSQPNTRVYDRTTNWMLKYDIVDETQKKLIDKAAGQIDYRVAEFNMIAINKIIEDRKFNSRL